MNNINGHNFIDLGINDDGFNDFKCKNCGLEIFKSNNGYGYLFTDPLAGLIVEDDEKSCDEYIIKLIIE